MRTPSLVTGHMFTHACRQASTVCVCEVGFARYHNLVVIESSMWLLYVEEDFIV